MNTDKICKLGRIISILMVIIGILFISKSFGGDRYSYVLAYQSNYDSGLASFGGDSYTYINNNAAIAASAAKSSSNNIASLVKVSTNFFGCFFIFFGALSYCFFSFLKGFAILNSEKTQPLQGNTSNINFRSSSNNDNSIIEPESEFINYTAELPDL